MNIFVLDDDPVKAAQFHCDKHVVKMITESAQMLCSVLHLQGYDAPYKLTHARHPCTLWANDSQSNWLWLYNFSLYLYSEYRHRYGEQKTHKAGEVIKTLQMPKMIDKGRTPFAQAMPDQYKHPNAVIAYRAYYLGEKKAILTYKNRQIPYWIANAK